MISYRDNPNDVYDSRKFSTDDRKTLNENLSKSFSNQVDKQTSEIKSLEEKLTRNEASNSEKKKYQEMRTLKEVVKARKPETIANHVSMISDDLSRIVKSTGSDVSDKYEENILPTEFALHQNYPNPFNPVTKISFDLPQDSKVNLVVYDLLGREVTRLVNNESKVAGNYTYDFNAASLSSGVYFYKLVVSSSNPINAGNYSETKRMVLLK
ncbi:MAG: T9SS type A sorting domain-containing protein [Ignavibacteria bacterium]|nr:T9SS type A sorting domain-containing protein [Ignavibacteria bacterium]